MANLNWMGIDRYDLAHVAAGYLSCIGYRQLLRLVDGTSMKAEEILRAVRAGERIDFRTPDVAGTQECANPVIGAVRTYGRGVRIGFADGRSVELTTGHVLPLDAEWTYEAADEYSRLKGWRFPVDQQMIIRAGQVEPGMCLLDGVVKSVQELGDIDAVRLWTAHPAWLHTETGLRIGSRWHEILHAWARVREECFDHEGFSEIVPVSASGFLWGTGRRSRSGEWELLNAEDKSRRYKPHRNSRHQDTGGVNLAALGAAETVRGAIFERWHQAAHAPSQYLSLRQQRQIGRRDAWDQILQARDLPVGGKLGDIFGDLLAKVRVARYPRLVWSRPDRFTDLLVSGREVIGQPVVARHLALAA